ncbi:MAG: alpha/beta hydrolase [Micromonosporaceae bacterium]|nr:alpha/beta hydrolase [Micromonosporaceae bacterium]
MSGKVVEPARSAASRGRIAAGVVGSLVGLAAAGVAAGIAGRRALLRRQRDAEPDPYQDEAFGELPADEYRTVTTAEGIPLHVELVGPAWARTTVIFVHGFCLDMGTFHFQRRALSQVDGMPRSSPERNLGAVRAVFYDQPGHGRSGRLPAGEYTVDLLASALRTVIETCAAPDSRVVLVGHSMGGMTIMALATRFPDLFAPDGRVARVALISTSAGGVTFGLPDLVVRFRERLLPLISNAGTATAPVVDRARSAAKDLARLLTRKYGFGSLGASPSLVSYVEQMNGAMPTESVARYICALYGHACEPGASALKRVPVLVISGDEDHVIPVEHSRNLARELPHAELVIIPGAGHVALLECSDVVNDILFPFIRRIGA